jgi:hypothetical protein
MTFCDIVRRFLAMPRVFCAGLQFGQKRMQIYLEFGYVILSGNAEKIKLHAVCKTSFCCSFMNRLLDPARFFCFPETKPQFDGHKTHPTERRGMH